LLSEDQKLGPLTSFIFDHFLVIFQWRDAGVYSAAILLGLAIAACVYLYISSRRLQKQITTVRQQLFKIKDRNEFSTQYESVHQRFVRSSLLQRAWFEFEETLIPPRQSPHFNDNHRYKVFQNTHRPHAYFNADVISDLHVRSVPAATTFVGIGLVITFLGLVAALTEASMAFSADTTDGAAIEAAIGSLLTVAGSKFFASIGGLIGSILVAAVQNSTNNKTDQLTLELCNDLEDRLLFVTQAHISADQFEYAVRQTARLEELKDSLAVSIGQEFKKTMHSMPGPLADAIELKLRPVVDSIDKMAQKITDNAESSTSNMARQAAQEFGETTRNAMTNVGDRIDEVSEKINTASKEIASTQAIMSKASESLGPILDKSVTALELSGTINSELGQIVNSLNTSVSEAQKNTLKTSTFVSGAIEQLKQSWDKQSKQLDISDAELDKVFSKVLNMLERSSETQLMQFERMDSAIAKIDGHLKTGQTDLAESIEDLTEVLGKIPTTGGR